MSEGKALEISIIHLPDETVAVTGFRYVVVLSGEAVDRPISFAYPSLYKMVNNLRQLGELEWTEIEAGLAKNGAWKITTLDPKYQRILYSSF